MSTRIVVLVAALFVGGCYARMSTGVAAGAASERAASEIPEQPRIECPEATRWNGEVCVWRYIIADVSCPEGSAWDGSYCIVQDVRCPEGAEWQGDHCAALVAGNEAKAASDPPKAERVEPAAKDDDIFGVREGKSEPPREAKPGQPEGNNEDIFDARASRGKPPKEPKKAIFDDR